MASITQRQKRFLENFLLHSNRVIQNGFAYLFSHPNLIPMMDCEMKRIRAMEREQRQFPEAKARYQQMLRFAYIEYIIKLTKFGFKYVKSNPEAFNEIKALQSIFDEYEKLRQECQRNDKNRRSTKDDENQNRIRMTKQKVVQPDDSVWKETFKQFKDLNTKMDALQVKVAKPQEFKPKCSLKDPQETLKKFNEYLEDKLNDMSFKKQQRQQKRETLKRFVGKSPEILKIADSDNDSSEVLINFEQFEKPLLSTPRAGTIERHLVVPIQGKESPKIKPQIKFNKVDGKMELELNLIFDNGVIYQNKLVDGICIQNALPDRNYRSKK